MFIRTSPTICFVLGSSLLLSTMALGADLQPVGPLDGRASGKASSARTAADGSIYTNMTIQGGQKVISEADMAAKLGESASDSDAYIVERAAQASLFAGFGVSKSLELSLGLHGVQEKRGDGFEAYGSESATVAANNSAVNRFSGASLLAKARLFQNESFALALAPFVESGAGANASESLTRGVKPRAGWMLLTSYGTPGAYEISLNGGFRYRQSEDAGDLSVRNEGFWRAGVKSWLSQSFAVFAGLNGRRLMVADSQNRDPLTNKLRYDAVTSYDGMGGIALSAGQTEFSAFYGSTMKGAFGAGKSFAGASLTWTIDQGSRGRGGRASFADEVRSSDKSEKTASDKGDKSQQKSLVSEYPEMDATEIDPLQDVAGENGDDFSVIEARMKEDAKSKNADQMAVVERELAAIKDAENKAAEARSKAEQAALEKERAANVKAAKERAGTVSKWNKEAQDEAAKLDGIDDEELNWMGLE